MEQLFGLLIRAEDCFSLQDFLSFSEEMTLLTCKSFEKMTFVR